MSGIGLLVEWGADPSEAQLRAMVANVAHRGLDAPTSRRVGECVLVHAQFASTPEARLENQPTRHVDRDWWLVADARIDNRPELRRRLESGAQPLETDADFILAAYEKWGTEMHVHLIGDFAFAIWDAEQRRVVLGRDHVGVRPLYFASTGRGFVAGSSLKLVRDALPLSDQLDLVYLASFLTYWPLRVRTNDDESKFFRSPYRDVSRLAPAHSAVVSARSTTIRRYWSPPDEARKWKREELAEAVRETVVRSVVDRLRGAAPIAIEMSGGYDSSTVAAVAGMHGTASRLRTFSIPYFGSSASEVEYADAAAAFTGITHEYVDTFGLTVPDLGAITAETGEFPGVFGSIHSEALQRHIGQSGYRVVLTGQGGDHALLGDSRPNRDGRLRSSLRGAAFARRSPARQWMAARRRRRRFDGLTWIDGAVLTNCPNEIVVLPIAFRAREQHRTRIRNYAENAEVAELLERWSRTYAMDGLEPRHPFFDRRVIEVLATVDNRLLVAGDQERSLHVDSLGEYLPSLIRERRGKASFDDPVSKMVDAWLEQRPPAPEMALAGVLRATELDAAVELRRHHGHVPWLLERALCVEEWLKRVR